MKQQTQEWLDLRKSKIGASDAPVLMRDSPWKTPYTLWLEKLGYYEQPRTQAMQRGIDLEPVARQKLEEHFGRNLQPAIVFHPKINFMMASLDCLDANREICVEIKTANAIDHKMAKEGKIPQKYYAQLQHQMCVLDMDSMFYYSFDGQEGEIVPVNKNNEYIDLMIGAESSFYECMMTLEPPTLFDKDYLEINDSKWQKCALEFIETKRARKELEEKEKVLTDQLIQMAKGQNCYGAGIKLTKVVRKGNVDYQSIPAFKEIDIEQYRKKPTSYWKFTDN